MSKSKEVKDTKKVEKKDTKKVTKKNTKKVSKAKEPFIGGVIKEMKHVRWPLKKEMIKYSIATLSFIIFFALFFILANVIVSFVKVLV